MIKTIGTIIVVAVILLASCSKPSQESQAVPPPTPLPTPTVPLRQPDPAIQMALDELKRLQSCTETGLNYAQYSDRLLTAKGNIDVALQRTADEAEKDKIQSAVKYYISARDQWKTDLDNDSHYMETFRQEDWRKGSDEADFAAKYAVADIAKRREMDAEAAQQAEEEAKAAEAAQKQAQEAQEQADAAAAAEKAREAEREAEQERARRFTPEGVGYSTMLISITTQDGVASIPPATELRVLKKNPDGTLHIQSGDLIADVPAADITNDRDLAAAVRANDGAKQAAIRQWQAEQSAAAAEMEAEKKAGTYVPPSKDSTPQP